MVRNGTFVHALNVLKLWRRTSQHNSSLQVPAAGGPSRRGIRVAGAQLLQSQELLGSGGG